MTVQAAPPGPPPTLSVELSFDTMWDDDGTPRPHLIGYLCYGKDWNSSLKGKIDSLILWQDVWHDPTNPDMIAECQAFIEGIQIAAVQQQLPCGPIDLSACIEDWRDEWSEEFAAADAAERGSA